MDYLDPSLFTVQDNGLADLVASLTTITADSVASTSELKHVLVPRPPDYVHLHDIDEHVYDNLTAVRGRPKGKKDGPKVIRRRRGMPTGGTKPATTVPTPTATASNGARGRGRPPGSKNRPKSSATKSNSSAPKPKRTSTTQLSAEIISSSSSTSDEELLPGPVPTGVIIPTSLPSPSDSYNPSDDSELQHTLKRMARNHHPVLFGDDSVYENGIGMHGGNYYIGGREKRRREYPDELDPLLHGDGEEDSEIYVNDPPSLSSSSASPDLEISSMTERTKEGKRFKLSTQEALDRDSIAAQQRDYDIDYALRESLQHELGGHHAAQLGGGGFEVSEGGEGEIDVQISVEASIWGALERGE